MLLPLYGAADGNLAGNLPYQFLDEDCLVRVAVPEIALYQVGHGAGPVSYTHLDVYKRQIATFVEPHSSHTRISESSGFFLLDFPS